MIDYKETLISSLSALGYPVQYELFLNSSQTFPCITYIELDNDSLLEGDTLRYSNLAFTIKVWGKKISTLSAIAAEIDAVLKPLGFTRTFSTEMSEEGVLQKIMRYSSIGYEK